jgi:hypothetical protein
VNAPDYPSALTAYRVWGVTGPPDDARLQSTAAGFWSAMPAWPARVRLEASCLTPRRCPDGGVPGVRHCCGIYGLKTLDAARQWGRHVRRVRSTVIVGEVGLWGTVVESALGWRAQYAYPIRLLEVVPGRKGRPVDLAPLADAYAVPVAEPALVLS